MRFQRGKSWNHRRRFALSHRAAYRRCHHLSSAGSWWSERPVDQRCYVSRKCLALSWKPHPILWTAQHSSTPFPANLYGDQALNCPSFLQHITSTSTLMGCSTCSSRPTHRLKPTTTQACTSSRTRQRRTTLVLCDGPTPPTRDD